MKHLLNTLRSLGFHPDIRIRTIITIVYCVASVAANFLLLQVVCMPVWWASMWSLLFFGAIVLFPFIKDRYVKKVMYFFIGSGIPICIYYILFLADPWDGFKLYIFYVVTIIIGLGLLAFIPFYLLYHSYKYSRQAQRDEKLIMLGGTLLPICFFIIYIMPFKAELQAFENVSKTENEQPRYKKNHFTERFLGIGLKYHTKLEFVYDGWRPPLHDPFLNVGLWIYSDTYFPQKEINRKKYYQALFPELPVKANCPCSYTRDGLSYFED